MTEAYFYIDGRKVRVPMHPYEAPDLGWHLGVEYASPIYLRSGEYKYTKIAEWCKATFDPHTYQLFTKSVWFLDESDALLCKLRWS